MRDTKVSINTEKLQLASEIVRALAHPLRLRILAFINSKERVNVNKIYNALNIEQSITSQHLRILRLAEIVFAQRDGKFIYYSINYSRIENTKFAIDNFLNAEEEWQVTNNLVSV